MIQTFHQSGPEAKASHTQFTSYEVQGAFGRDRTKADPRAVLRNHLSRVQARAEQSQAQVEAFNAEAADRNARIQAVQTETGQVARQIEVVVSGRHAASGAPARKPSLNRTARFPARGPSRLPFRASSV